MQGHGHRRAMQLPGWIHTAAGWEDVQRSVRTTSLAGPRVVQAGQERGGTLGLGVRPHMASGARVVSCHVHFCWRS